MGKRYVIFRIPSTRTVTKGGWDDFWHWTDDLTDAKALIEDVSILAAVYQIVDLTTGEVILEIGLEGN